METIPTPRTNKAFKSFADDALYEESARLERELHIAKQALDNLNTIMQDELCGLVEFDQCRQKVTETINTLSA